MMDVRIGLEIARGKDGSWVGRLTMPSNLVVYAIVKDAESEEEAVAALHEAAARAFAEGQLGPKSAG